MKISEAKEELAPIIKRMPAYLKLITRLYREPGLNKKQKALLTAGMAYALSPIDLVPGIIPVAGQLDDIIVALVSIKQAIKSLPPIVAAEYEKETGITVAEIDADLQAAKKVAGYLTKAAAGYAWKGIKFVVMSGFKLVKQLIYER